MRVVAVTGVQTCALPISAVLPQPGQAGIGRKRDADRSARGVRVEERGDRELGGRGADHVRVRRPAQIGRASCREREESWVVVVTIHINILWRDSVFVSMA